ncbi:hypothetical protein EJB05_20579, partial [Eragrostis curvula]
MRTRFLATDYLAPSAAAADASSDQALALAALPFPSLPVPTLPPDPYLPDLDPFAADLLPAVSVDGDDLDSLPATSALSEFLAAFVPRPLPVPDIPDAEVSPSRLRGSRALAVWGVDDYLYDRGGNGKGFSSRDPVAWSGLGETSNDECKKEEGTSLGTSTITERWDLLEELRFEVIEIDFLQRKLASLDDEEPDSGVTVSFGIPEAKFHLDFIDLDTETTIAYPVELAESIYQVEKFPVVHDVDKDCSFTRDNSCLEIAKLDLDVMIPQLEMNRYSWELDECSTKAEISNIFLSVVEHLNDGAQVHHPECDSTEFLKSDVDMWSLVCKDAPRVDYQADKPITDKAIAEMDLVRINDNILVDKKSAIYPLKPDGTCSDLPCSVRLEEIEIFDIPSNDVFKMLVQSEKVEMKPSDEIFKDDFDSARQFYESLVSSELALVDDTFRSLPVPVLNDDKIMKSVLPSTEEILSSLKPLPLSAADGIYLDWHLLLEEPCKREICSTYASMVEEVKPCSLSSELKTSCQQTTALGIDFLEDFQRSPMGQHEDKQREMYVPMPISHDPPAKLETTHRRESDNRDHSHMKKLSSENVSSLFESISQSDGLNFYLNARSDTNGVRNNRSVVTLDIPPSKRQPVVTDPVSVRPKIDKVIEIHPVSLSDLIRGLIKDIHVRYTSALGESAYLRHSFSDGQGLSISKQKLLELITREGSEGLYNNCKLEDKMVLIVLYALKQVAYYLCFFGLHAAHLYIGNLTGSFENIPERLRNIQCCIDEAQLNAEQQLLESHPSLSEIETILRSNTQIGQRILIIADRAFWLTLGQKLTSMKMTFVEVGKYPATTYSDPVTKTSSKDWVLKDLGIYDCILLDNKEIPASFPFSEFGIILEYGGPNKSSALLSLAPKLDGLPPLHFLYVKEDGEDFPVALIEDNHTDQDLKTTMDTVLHTLQKDLQEKMNKMRIVDSLNFIPATNQVQHLQEKLSKHLTSDLSAKLPIDGHNHGNHGEKNIVGSHNFVPSAEQLESLKQITIGNPQSFVPAIEKSSSTSSVSAILMKGPQDNHSANDFPISAKIDNNESRRLSAPEAVIVVNTGNHGKCMLFSRRSSYQQILALEKGGIQVVERDVDLPVDLILSAAMCLVWYDLKTVGSSDLMVSAETPSLTYFTEDIATNILMSLSFSFSGCIMIFEGESHLLSDVTVASDSLYASAASLDMSLQIFCSQTPKFTDQIILNCIRNALRINRVPSPDVFETESLAESFLTAFPSVNPLSAHMILSSGSLVNLLSWSHEQRIQAVEKYLLPPQSISLFSALCKFGELGESRSVMTDCSSVDSDISSALLHSPRRRKKRALQDVSVPINDPVRANTLNQLCGDYVEHDKVFSPPKLRKFSDMEDTLPELPEAFMFDRSLNLGSEGACYQPRKHDMNAVPGNQMMYDDFSNGLTPNLRTYNERTSSMVDRCNFSSQSELGGKKPIRSTFATSRPSLGRTCSQPTFPTALEINNDLGEWDIPCSTYQTGSGHLYGEFATSSCRDGPGRRYHEPEDDIMQNTASSLAFLNQDFGSRPTSQRSSWEIDYLRQMNEKRISRQERYGCKASATLSNPRMRDCSPRTMNAPPIESFRYQRNTHTPSRDQSPSSNGAHRYGPAGSVRYQITIDTPVRDQGPSNGALRYGKGREGTRVQSNRLRKDFKIQPSINHEKSIGPSIEPSWTPVDKRARQTDAAWRLLLLPPVGQVRQRQWRRRRLPRRERRRPALPPAGDGAAAATDATGEGSALLAAGRLAAEYLVSRGDLPPHVLENRPPAPIPSRKQHQQQPAPHRTIHFQRRPPAQPQPQHGHFQWELRPYEPQRRQQPWPRPFQQGGPGPFPKRPRQGTQQRPFPYAARGAPAPPKPGNAGQGAAASVAASKVEEDNVRNAPAGDKSESLPTAQPSGVQTPGTKQTNQPSSYSVGANDSK